MRPFREYTRDGLLEIINALPLAISVIDQTRSVVLANKVTQEFTNKNKDQLIGQVGGKAFACINHGKTPQGCGFGKDCIKCKLNIALEETLKKRLSCQMIETTMVFEKKGERVLRFSTQPLNLAGQEVALLSIEDLTEIRTHERVRLEKEKLAAVLETTGAVCHELSQPLQVIMGYCDILAEYKSLNKETSNALAAINKEIKKLANLTHDLTNITRYKTKPYLRSKIIDIAKSSTDI